MEQVNGTSTTDTKTPAAKAKIKAFDPVEFARRTSNDLPPTSEDVVAIARHMVEVTTSIKSIVGGGSVGAIAGTVAGVVLGRKAGLEGQALVDASCVGFAVGAKAGALTGWGAAAVYNRLSR